MEINNIQCIKQILIPPSRLKEKTEIINSCHTPRIIQFKSSQWPEIVKNIKRELKTKIKQQMKPLQSHSWTWHITKCGHLRYQMASILQCQCLFDELNSRRERSPESTPHKLPRWWWWRQLHYFYTRCWVIDGNYLIPKDHYFTLFPCMSNEIQLRNMVLFSFTVHFHTVSEPLN